MINKIQNSGMTHSGQTISEAGKTLWCVNIHGPDDIIAAPDYLTAVRMANAFNDWLLNLKTKQIHDDAIHARMWAVPIEWPRDNAQGHADELSKPHPEYQWLRDALTAAAPYMQGVRPGSLVNEAGILASDMPHTVVKKLDAAHEADFLSALESSSAREQALEEAAKALDDLIDYWRSLPTFNRSYAMRSTIKVASDLRALKSQPAPSPQSLVIIESPYAGDVAVNESYARACLLDCLRRGEAPIASHLLHTQVLDDMQPDERELGIEAGLAWYRVADKCVVYTDRGVSGGMTKGIERANRYGVPVEYRTLNEGQPA